MKEILTKEQKEALKEFHNKVSNCKCGRILAQDKKYCDNCKKLFCDFMDKWGMGILCGDVELYYLKKTTKELESENESLKLQLENKIKDYEKLKNDN